jgi:hypothetical protein
MRPKTKTTYEPRPWTTPVVIRMKHRKCIYAKIDNLIMPEAFLARAEVAFGYLKNRR